MPDQITQTATADVSAVQNGRRGFAVDLLAQGYTTRMIIVKMTDADLKPYGEVELVLMRQQYAPQIDDLRERGEVEVLTRGLARRSERVRRLALLGEKLEHGLALDDPEGPVPLKVSVEYRKTLGQIQAEVDPLGLRSALDPDDPWMIMITKLMLLGEARQSLSSLPLQKDSESKLLQNSIEHSSPEQDSSLSQVVSVEASPSTQPSN